MFITSDVIPDAIIGLSEVKYCVVDTAELIARAVSGVAFSDDFIPVI